VKPSPILDKLSWLGMIYLCSTPIIAVVFYALKRWALCCMTTLP
jgi:hypothetical protein